VRALITGGCGFIGHHLVEHCLKNTDWELIVLDSLDYASRGYDRLRDINCFDDKRVKIIGHDITLPLQNGIAYEIGQVDYILHLAAQTHVENSIADPRPFVRANVLGTMEMLEFARRQKDLKWFVYFSTDEVFGPASHKYQLKPVWQCQESAAYHEWDRYNSTNPYSATKAAGEELSLAYANTYKVPLFVTHCMNALGQRQHPEKYVPLVINKVLKGETVTIHADASKTVPGSRSWIHARNIAAAVLFLLGKAAQREKYNIAGEMEVDNLSMARNIADELESPLRYELTDFHSSRPGHDLRYALDGSKMVSLGWKPPVNFYESLRHTISWYVANPKWLEWT
jgi:dTDP-glucose 4,6-dehydratase